MLPTPPAAAQVGQHAVGNAAPSLPHPRKFGARSSHAVLHHPGHASCMQLQPRAAGTCSGSADCGALSLAACETPAWLDHLRNGEARTHLAGALWLPNAAATAAPAAAAAAPASRGLHLARSAVCLPAHQPVASFISPAVCSMPRVNVRVTVQDACSGL